MTGRTTRSVQFRQPRLGRRPTEPSPEPGAARSLTRSLLFSLTIILGFAGASSATEFASSPAPGASPNAALDEASQAAFPSRIVGLLSSGQPAGDLLGVVTWTVGPTGEEGDTDWSLQVIAEVDGAGLLAGHEGDSLRVDVFGYVLSAEGVLVSHFNQSHILLVGDDDARLRLSGLRVVQPVQVPPGSYSLRIVIENPDTRRYFLSTTVLELTEPDSEQPTLLPPLVQDDASAWVIARPANTGTDEISVWVDGQSYIPAARIVVTRARPIEMLIVGSGWDSEAPLAARVVDRNGVTRAEPTIDILDGQDPKTEFPAHYRATLGAIDLPADIYVLELTVGTADAAQGASRAVPIVVTAERRESVWATGTPESEAGVAESSELRARHLGSIAAQTAALLLSGQRGGEVAGSMIWTVGSQVPGNDLVELPFFVELEGDSLLAEQSGPTLNLGIFAYAISSDGVLVAHLGQGLSLDLRVYGDQLLASGLKFAGRLTMPPGLHSLRLLARNQDSGRVFLTISQVEVPGVDHEVKTLLPPVFDEPNENWVLTRQSDLELDSIGLRLGDDRVLPATRVVVVSRVPTELVLGGAGWDTATRVTARVLDRQGRHVATPIVTIGSGVGVSQGPVSFFRATLGAFDLPLGWYTLEVILDDEASGSRLTRQIPVAVLSYGTPEVWASLDRPSGAASTARPSTDTTAIELAEEEIVAGYLSALRSLARGDRYEARDALIDLEQTLVNGGSRWAVATLERTERRIARQLSGSDPDVIVPILLLHRDAFRQYLTVRNDLLANHSWRLIATLAEDAPRGLRSGQWAGFSETLLVALAADLVRASLVSSAIELLQRTVELAPSNLEALLALGATLERSGEYEEALSPLRRLVRDHPDAAEGALRLAVNLARTGDANDAKEIFRNLIAGRSPGWIQVLSYQELARLVVSATAEKLLREGVDRFPSNQAMKIQLACLLDHHGRAVEAGKLVESVTSRAAAPDTSPRVRYLAWPSLGLVEELSTFELIAEQESSGLVAALDERASEQERS